MKWVTEDYAELARLIDGANRWSRNETALAPGRLILRLRRGLQISQSRLAELAGMPRSIVGRAEAGLDIQISSLRRLLAALNCGLIILPASEKLLAHFKGRVEENRRNNRQWENIKKKLEGQSR